MGLLLATAWTSLISRIQGTTIPVLGDVRVDVVVLAFTALVAVLTSVAVGILPALRATAAAVPTALAEGSRGSTEGRSGRIRRAIVVTEIALGCVLLTGAGLLTRSLLQVLDVHPGFATTNLLVMRVDPVRAVWYRHDLHAAAETTREERSAFLHAVAREVATVPGVEALGLTDALPLGAISAGGGGGHRWLALPPRGSSRSFRWSA